MAIDIKYVLYIIGSIIAISTAVVTFFQMQTKQNMKIEALECKMEKVEKRLSEQSHFLIITEKAIVEINTKLAHIIEVIEELKNK